MSPYQGTLQPNGFGQTDSSAIIVRIPKDPPKARHVYILFGGLLTILRIVFGGRPPRVPRMIIIRAPHVFVSSMTGRPSIPVGGSRSARSAKRLAREWTAGLVDRFDTQTR